MLGGQSPPVKRSIQAAYPVYARNLWLSVGSV
jgi:hypothetical protein